MITSKDNSRVKHARNVREGRVREEIFVEGLRLCEEVLKAKLEIIDIIFTSEFVEKRVNKLLQNFPNAIEVSEKVFATISDTKTPQGICIIAKRPNNSLQSVDNKVVVVLHQINNPSNVGAILRTCEAVGVSGVILTKGTSDAFSAKTLRGSMGASLRLKIWEKVEFTKVIEFCKSNNLITVCADIRAKKSYTEIDWSKPHAVILGSEAKGLSESERQMCVESLKIPMCEPVESLNVAVAAGVILFEAKKSLL